MDEQVPGPGTAPAQTPPDRPATRPPARPRPDFKPVDARPVPTSWGMRLAVVAVLLLAGLGGMYIYGTSKVPDAIAAFQEDADRQRPALLGLGRSVTDADIEAFALRVIEQHGFKLTPGTLRVVRLPYPPPAAYPPNLSQALRRAPRLGKGVAARSAIGFSAEVTVRRGIISKTFTTDHYTLFELGVQ
jgi:hypothetical protein